MTKTPLEIQREGEWEKVADMFDFIVMTADKHGSGEQKVLYEGVIGRKD